MADYINKQAFLDYMKRTDRYFNVKFDIESFPNADVAPVVHGRWIDAYPDIEPNPMFMYGFCSECGFEQGISKYLKYCPNCGAKMDEKEE